jgi:SAM-dependent methyltransferase
MKKAEAIIDFYEKQFKEHGPNNVLSLGWGSRWSQTRRFEVLTEVGIKDGDSVLDVGCGFGDYKTFLNLHDIKAGYSGLDINKAFLVIAEENHKGIKFVNGNMVDISSSYDWVIASGIFALDYENWDIETMKTLGEMAGKAKKGIAINFLSSFTKRKGISINKFVDPAFVVNEFVVNLSSRFSLRHDYFDNDFTVYIYK